MMVSFGGRGGGGGGGGMFALSLLTPVHIEERLQNSCKLRLPHF